MAIPTQVYAADRTAKLWVLDPTTLQEATSWPDPVLEPQYGPAIFGLAFDPSTNGVYLAGVPNGYNSTIVGLLPVNEDGEYVFEDGTPATMPTGTFQPDAIALDTVHQRMFVADALRCLTAWNTSEFDSTGEILPLAGSPYYLTNGLIKAQGVAYDPNHNRVYVCIQNASQQDELVAFDASTGPPMTQVTGSPFAKTLGLSTSFTSIAYDTLFNRILITSSLGLIVLDATSSTYAPIAGSPFSLGTGTLDHRGVAFDATNSRVYVCNFGSDNLSVLNATSASPYLQLMTGSPYATGHGPRQVVYSASQNKVYVANLNGNPGPASTAGGLTVFAAPGMTVVTTPSFLSSLAFVSLAVGP
jgi:DNA-binding beta-propeller fold protein YncE